MSLRERLADNKLVIALAIVIVAAAVGLSLLATAPPKRLVIATDGRDGYFTHVAEMYRTALARQGVTLEIRTTEGAVDNVRRMNAASSDIDLAFVPGGLTSEQESPDFESLGSVAYDPIWIATRRAPAPSSGEPVAGIHDLPALRGKRIGVGHEGGATSALARRILAAAGVDAATATLVPSDDAINERKAIASGALDAGVFVGPPEDRQIHALFDDEALEVMNLSSAEGMARNLPFLHALKLPEGTVDVARDRPERALSLVASTVTLVVRKNVHPALVYLFMSVIDRVHEAPSLLHAENEFPSDKDVDLPLNPQADAYYKSGKPFLQRYLPFGLASAVERLLKIAVPIGLVIVPVVRVFPAFNLWRVRRKLARTYRQLLELERDVQADPKRDRQAAQARYDARLAAIEAQLQETRVPLLYSNELYIVREHIELARRHVREAFQA